MGESVENLECDLCGSINSEFLFSNHDRMFPEIEGSYDLYQCQDCGLIWVDLNNNPDLSRHYSTENYTVLNDQGDTQSLRRAATLLETLYHFSSQNKDQSKFFKMINWAFLPASPFFRSARVVENGNYLDVGCGMGYFPLVMKYLGMNPHGVEPGAIDQTLAQKYNLNIFQGTLEEARYEDDYFDVITLNHVLEHVYKPSEMMDELHRILKPGGYLVIGVPVSDSAAFKVFGKYWAQLDTPRHLFVFSTENLKKYAQKHDFKMEKIRYNSEPRYQIISSLIYFLENKFNKNYDRMILHNIFLNSLLLPITGLLNASKKGDQCELILQKP